MRYEKLLLVSKDDNFNRFFEMEELANDTFITRTGRVEARPVEKVYSMKYWDKVLQKHVNKGFVKCGGVTKKVEKRQRFQPIENVSVNELFNCLIKASSLAIQNEYTVTVEGIDKKTLSKAQRLVNDLGRSETPEAANQILCELFVMLPRRMRNVSDYLLPDMEHLSCVFDREQSLLDVLKTQKQTIAGQHPDLNETILDRFGLTCRPFTDLEEKQTVSHMVNSKNLFVRGYRVHNKKQDAAFDAYMHKHGYTDKDVHFFYHGSKTMNYLNILASSLQLNPNAPITGKMFGQGLYFADDPDKSIGYTDLSGSRWANGHSSHAYLMIFKVAYKNPFHTDRAQSHLNSHNIRPYDACFAHKGNHLMRNEYIVYNEAQCTPYAIIEIKNNK